MLEKIVATCIRQKTKLHNKSRAPRNQQEIDEALHHKLGKGESQRLTYCTFMCPFVWGCCLTRLLVS